MTERAPPSRTAISNGGRMTSASSRGPSGAGAWLRAPREAEYPAKCLRVATIPAASRPRAYAVPMVPTRYGSSPMASSVRPQRGSRTTSRTGARPWWMPTARIDAPMACAISVTRAGSKLAPQASGVGKTVACQAEKPVRHSSWAMAGTPNRLPARIRDCSSASRAAPSAGSTGTVPKGRVRCPRPCGSRASRAALRATYACWPGATAAVSVPMSAPSHTLDSWAVFSSGVIRASRSAARTRAGRVVSCQGCAMELLKSVTSRQGSGDRHCHTCSGSETGRPLVAPAVMPPVTCRSATGHKRARGPWQGPSERRRALPREA